MEGGGSNLGGGSTTITMFSLALCFYFRFELNDKIVRDYLNLEVLCTMDGFKSHHNGNEALKTFLDNNIRMVK